MVKLICIFLFIGVSITIEAQIQPFIKKEILPALVDTPKIYVSAEVMPQFPGGEAELMRYIVQNLKCTSLDKSQFSENDRVRVRFVIRETGEIDDITFLMPLAKPFEAEITCLLKKMPKWTPGEMGGKPVACYYTLPILLHFQTK